MSTFSVNNEQCAKNKALLQTVALEANNYKLKSIMNEEEISQSKNIDNRLINNIIACN